MVSNFVTVAVGNVGRHGSCHYKGRNEIESFFYLEVCYNCYSATIVTFLQFHIVTMLPS